MKFRLDVFIFTSTYNSVIRKVDPSGDLIWKNSFPFKPTTKSMAVNSVESNLYLATVSTSSTPVMVVSLNTIDGGVDTWNSL